MASNSEKRETVFEDIFEQTGHVGAFQICLYILGSVIDTALSLSILFFPLEYAQPGWTCQQVLINSELGEPPGPNDTLSARRYVLVSDNLTENVCPSDGFRCENVTYNKDYTSISTEWDLICERRYLGRLTASLFFVGVLTGAVISGYLSDTFGRKKTVLGLWVGLIIFQTCSGFAPIWPVYLPLRILAGIFAGGCSTISMVLPVEYLGPKYRVIASVRFGWQIGGLSNALLGHLLRKWHYIAMANGLITLPFVPIFAIFMPESARWLIQKGRVKEAGRWIKMIAKYNRRPPPDLSILDDIAKSEQAKQQSKETYSYIDLFRTRKYAIRSPVLILGWFDIAFVAYGMGADMERLSGNLYLNIAFLNIAVLALRWFAIPLANRFGRRKTYLFYKLMVMACFVTVMALAVVDHDKYGMVITGMVVTSFVFQSGVWAMVATFSSEAYPTLLRTRAIAVGNTANRVSGILAPQVGLLAVYHKAIPYALYLTIGVVTMVLFYGIMPETNGRPLPEDLPPHKRKRRQEEEKMEELIEMTV